METGVWSLESGEPAEPTASYVVEVSRLRYWVLNSNISERGLAGPNKRQYVLVNGEAPYWLINFFAF